MFHGSVRAASALGVAVTVVLALAVTGAAAAPAMTRAPAAATLLPGPLSGVSAVSPSDAWAVGYYDNTSGGTDTLILHWNGTTWSQVPSPSPSPGQSELSGVSAVSGSDAWAVGSYFDSATNVNETLILHWNGTAWARVASPSPGTGDALYGVSADSGSDAWAVGDQVGPDDTVILHWNGTTWSQVPSPNPSSMVNQLTGVSAVSGSDAWAVGQYYQSHKATYQTLILRWNGTAWTRVYSPSPSLALNELSGVSADSSGDAWAVGWYRDTSIPAANTLILRWNGTAWKQAASPSPGSGSKDFNILSGVSADSGSDAWAVGFHEYVNAHNRLVTDTLILRWNGTAWTKAASPSPGNGSTLNGVSVVSPSDAWAAGTLILHWNGTAWARA